MKVQDKPYFTIQGRAPLASTREEVTKPWGEKMRGAQPPNRLLPAGTYVLEISSVVDSIKAC